MCQLDLLALTAEARVFHKCLQLSEIVQLFDPAIPDFLGRQAREPRVACYHEPARGYAISDVKKFLWPKFIEVVQRCLLQKLGMQFGHSIDFMAADSGKISHTGVFCS